MTAPTPTTIRELRAAHEFEAGTYGDGYNEPQETWAGCTCGVLYDEWQQHRCPDDCPCREAEPVDVVTAHAEHVLAMAIRARLVRSRAGWRPPARVVRTVDELNACNDFATLHWVDDAGLPHAHIAVTMKEHARQLGELFGEPMWPMTVIHEGDDL